MNDLLTARILFGCTILCSAGGALIAAKVSQNNLPFWEKFTRSRWIGLIGGWIALAICVPHSVAVAPDFLLPFLWPLAVIVPILGFFFIDYPAARAIGGLLILLGYYLVHSPFECHTPGAPIFAAAGWIIGFAGIWISGIPCSLRDHLRRMTRSRVWKICTVFAWCIAGSLGVWGLLMTKGILK